MFTPENYSYIGLEYDYDTLNQLLADKIAAAGFSPDDYADAEKNASDEINDATTEQDGTLYCHGVVVGHVRREPNSAEE